MIHKQLLFIPLAAVFQGGTLPQATAQEPEERKVRIEVVTTENGETKRVTKEFDAANEAELQEALRELGVMEHMSFGEGDGRIDIDIRRHGGSGEDRSARYFMSPNAPMPPQPPGAPAVCEPVAYLGVSTKPSSNGEKGAVVTEVIEGTPAAALGLKSGDVITQVGNSTIEGPDALIEAICAQKPGDKVKVTWLRDGKKMNGNAELSQRKSTNYAFEFDEEDFEWMGESDEQYAHAEPRAFLGVTPADGDSDMGAMIGSVEEGTAAATMGIRAGDIIKSINGTSTADFDALADAVQAQQPGDAVKVIVDRDGKELTLNGTLGERKGHTMRGMREFHFEGMDPGDREDLRREMDELHREMESLRQELGNSITREVRISIETMPLSEEEKALLKGKGVSGLDAELQLKEMRVFPNPSNGFFRIAFDVQERGDLFVNVHDAKGDRVYEERITGFKGRYERTLDLTDKNTGTYFLVIQQDGKTQAQKLIKE
jgi:membrane-associated protease RseP (regulator of RpoE activity)